MNLKALNLVGKASPAYLRGCLATLGSESGLQEICWKLLTLHVSPTLLSHLTHPPPLISQVGSLPHVNPTVGVRSTKAISAAILLTLPGHPQICGIPVPKVFKKSNHLVSVDLFFFY